MVIVLEKNISAKQKESLRSFLEEKGFRVNEIRGEEDTIFGAVGKLSIDPREVEILNGVERVIPISKPYKMASREFKKENTVVEIVNNRGQVIRIGGSRFVSIAGPCAVENREQMFDVARRVAQAGAVMLRGGAYKPRTSPYAFQGLGAEGVKLLKEAGNAFGLPVVTEIVSADHIPDMIDYVDVYQIGARNMQNFELLKKVGTLGKPVILKRGLSATIEEWLMAAEYLLSSGTDDVILCERGIRTFERATRNTLDLSAIPIVRSLTHLPVIVDPSHAVGIRDKVPPMALAAVAAGADGIIVEVHCNPDKALSDGAQSLYPEQFEKLMRDIDVLAPLTGKETLRIRPQADRGEHSADSKNRCGTKTSAGGQNACIDCAFAGSHGAYAEQAARRYFDERVETLPYPNFRSLFQAVSEGRVSCAIVPIENSLAGSVYENYDNLIRFSDVAVAGGIKMRVEHSLLACSGASFDTIQTVYSHPQALAQCSDFLASHPDWRLVECSSTSDAAETVERKGSVHDAAIASQDALRCAKGGAKLEVLKTGIENNPRNYTRFLIICARDAAQAKDDTELSRLSLQNSGVLTASFAFVAKNESGALYRCLGVFERLRVNLTRLESRPVQGQPWRYMFYADAELTRGGTNIGEKEAQAVVADALSGLQEFSDEVHLLGLYTESF